MLVQCRINEKSSLEAEEIATSDLAQLVSDLRDDLVTVLTVALACNIKFWDVICLSRVCMRMRKWHS